MSAISCASYSRKTISKRRYHKIRILWSEDQAQSLHLARVFRAALHDIDPCCLHAGVAQEVRQLCDVLLQGIKRPGEEVAEVVGKDPLGLHPRLGAEARISRQMLDRSSGRPLRVTNTGPETMPRFRQYFPNVRHSLAVRRTRRPFPFPSTQARPVCRAWTVTYCSSDTRTPVEARVSMR